MFKQLVFSFFFFALAALPRTTHLIFLLSASATLLFFHWKNKSLHLKIFIPFLASLAVILIYFLWGKYLRENYGSIFMQKILPATNFNLAIALKKRLG